MRPFGRIFCVAALSLGIVLPAQAQDGYPIRPIRLIAPAALHDELVKILANPEVRDRIVADGSEPVGSSPESFRQFMLADTVKWAKLVKESGAKMD